MRIVYAARASECISCVVANRNQSRKARPNANKIVPDGRNTFQGKSIKSVTQIKSSQIEFVFLEEISVSFQFLINWWISLETLL